MSELITNYIEQVDGGLTIVNSQDCDPIAEMCKKLSLEGKTGTNEMRFAGAIPDVFVEKYCTDHGITFREFMGNDEHVRRILNDPAMAHFRVYKGRI